MLRKTTVFICFLYFGLHLKSFSQPEELLIPVHHSNLITSVEFSPDNKYLLTASKDNTVKLWDIRTKKCILNFDLHKQAVNKAVFSRNGKYFATAGNDNIAYVVDVKSRKVIARLELHKAPIEDIDFHTVRNTVITTSLDGYIYEWAFLKKKLIAEFKHNHFFGSYSMIADSTDIVINVSKADGRILFFTPNLKLDFSMLVGRGHLYTKVNQINYNYRLKTLVVATSVEPPLSVEPVSQSIYVYNFQKQIDTVIGISCSSMEYTGAEEITVIGKLGETCKVNVNSMEFSVSYDLLGDYSHVVSGITSGGMAIKVFKQPFGRDSTLTGNLNIENFKNQLETNYCSLLGLSNNGNFAAIVEADQISIYDFKGYKVTGVLNQDKKSTIEFATAFENNIYTAGTNGIGVWNLKNGSYAILSDRKCQSLIIKDRYLIAENSINSESVYDESEWSLININSQKEIENIPQGQYAGIFADTLYLIDQKAKQLISFDLLKDRINYRKDIFKLIGRYTVVFPGPNKEIFFLKTDEQAGGAPLTLVKYNITQETFEEIPIKLSLNSYPTYIRVLPKGDKLVIGSPISINYFEKGDLLFRHTNEKLGRSTLPSEFIRQEQFIMPHMREQNVLSAKEQQVFYTGMDSNVYFLKLDKSFSKNKVYESNDVENKRQYERLVFTGHKDLVTHIAVEGTQFLSSSRDNTAILWEEVKGKVHVLKGHRDNVIAGGFIDSAKLFTVSADHTVKVWNRKTGALIATLFTEGFNHAVLLSKYFLGSKNVINKFAYLKKNTIYPFEQLDVKYNRPDKVLEAIGNTDTALIKSYRKAWEKRIKKLGIDTTAFRDGYSVPEADFTNRDAIEYEQKNGTLKLFIKGNDSTYKLDRFNVWVNETPVFGQRGINIRKRNKNDFDTTITIKLSQGENRIETSITNVNGTESYRMPLTVNYTSEVKQKESVRFIGIGIDQFEDNKYNLQYSAKDIRDLSKKLKEKYKDDIIIDTLFNENVTTSNVKALKQKLLQTTENDKVIVAYSGHGMLSKEYDYYLSTYSVNFEKPEQNGLPYDELEDLLDSIPARKKLMLIDACHSGEVDKEDLITLNASSDSLIKGLKPVAYKKEGNLGLKNSFELMQSLFINVGKSTGATIISAAAGTQFALERNDLKNGVFTYSILEAMNKYSTIKISELKKIVGERVEQLTKGLQKPTSRNETIEVDWSLW